MSSQSTPLVAVRQVASESLYIEIAGGSGRERQQIEVAELARRGLVEIVDLQDEELSLFITYAAEIDDGEAAAIATCVRRGMHFVSDDRGAIKFVRDRALPISILRTSDIIRDWVRSAGPSPQLVQEILGTIQELARFTPPRSDPNYDWWTRSMKRSINVRL